MIKQIDSFKKRKDEYITQKIEMIESQLKMI